ncbi:SAV_2336 N-terminal domain-related protein [Streptomyces sp. NPDC056638]|uniref:SAV_2336 N-terminal domain-related protein n=1 Tax=Streptomyces sp. NPDC056638 TaxID=3345887 RepID=UPI0036AA1169
MLDIDRLRDLTGLFGGEVTAEELADVLWLAERVPGGADAPLALDGSSAAGAGRSDPAEVGPELCDGMATGPDAADAAGLHAAPADPQPTAPEPEGAEDTQNADDTGAEEPGGHPDEDDREEPPPLLDSPGNAANPPPVLPRAVSVRIAQPRGLASPLHTARALRPLKRLRADARRTEIDEAVTASQIAHTGLVDVVTRPGRERWLDLALVVDDSVSMLLWQQLYADIRALCARLGAFRQIRTWALRPDGPDGRAPGRPVLATRPFSTAGAWVPPGVICDPSGRTITLVITDGAGAAWRGSALRPVLTRWSDCGPTAIVHALPPRLWEGSALPVRRWTVRVPHPGAPNSQWRVRDSLLPPELSAFTGRALPVLEPTPQGLGRWARAAATGGMDAVFTLWDPEAATVGTSADIAHRDDVRRFRSTASPEAYRLAAHLAAIAPVTVPVMRLVTNAVPWQATTAHLAEVFLGGLMQLDENDRPADRGHGRRLFSFSARTRNVLLDAVPTAEIVLTARRVSTLVAGLAGQAPEFAAWLNRADGPETLPEHSRSFAWLGPALLQRLGLGALPVPEWNELPTALPREEPAPPPEPSDLLPPSFPPLDRAAPAPRRPWALVTTLEKRSRTHYRLVPRIGEIGWSGTHLGVSPEGHEVVLRTVRPEHVATEQAALARFAHDCLPSLIESDAAHSTPHWTASSVVGTRSGRPAPHLGQLVRSTGRLGVEAALCLAQRLAAALTHSHSAGVVHGRLQPRHVLLTEDGPLVTGWHRATIDGAPPGPNDEALRPQDDVAALGAIVVHAAYGTDPSACTPRYHADRGTLEPLDASDWEPSSYARDDRVLHTLVSTCLHGTDGPPTARDVLSLLRDRVPRGAASRPLGEWLSPSAVVLIDGARIRRTAPDGVGYEGVGPQVPVQPGASAAPSAAPKPVGVSVEPWLRLPGEPPQRPRRRRLGSRSRPAAADQRLAPIGPARRGFCIAVLGALPGSGRSTVAAHLASALAKPVLRAYRTPVIMVPASRRTQVFGYRVTPADSAGAQRFADGTALACPSGDDYLTFTDSSGARFLYVSVGPGDRLDLGTGPRRSHVEWVTQYGTTVVDASDSFLPPDGEALRGLLGSVDHLVFTATTGQGDKTAELMAWLARESLDLVDHSTVVLCDAVDDGDIDERLRASSAEFGRQAAQLRVIPYDETIRSQGLTELAALAPTTQSAIHRLARQVMASFPRGGTPFFVR